MGYSRTAQEYSSPLRHKFGQHTPRVHGSPRVIQCTDRMQLRPRFVTYGEGIQCITTHGYSIVWPACRAPRRHVRGNPAEKESEVWLRLTERHEHCWKSEVGLTLSLQDARCARVYTLRMRTRRRQRRKCGRGEPKATRAGRWTSLNRPLRSARRRHVWLYTSKADFSAVRHR